MISRDRLHHKQDSLKEKKDQKEQYRLLYELDTGQAAEGERYGEQDRRHDKQGSLKEEQDMLHDEQYRQHDKQLG